MVARAHAEALPVPNGVLDRVICFSVWPHFEVPTQVAAELWRVLKPGGVLDVLHVDGRETINRIHADAGGAVASDVLPPADVLAGLLSGVGFRPRELADDPDRYRVSVIRQGPA